jgi:hypothetical protein
MTTAILYIFLFSTWGLGLLSWISALGHTAAKWELDREEKKLDISQKKLLFGKFNSLTSSAQSRMAAHTVSKETLSDLNAEEIPEKVRELMKSSPNHPEVEEIDATDEILGVRFEAENYPPGFGDEDE